MNPFTSALLRELLKDQDAIKETCFLWLEEFPRDARKAQAEFARQLAADFVEESESWAASSGLTADFMVEAFRRVDWQGLAKELLARFKPPCREPYLAASEPSTN